jgi:hypothetical protein
LKMECGCLVIPPKFLMTPPSSPLTTLSNFEDGNPLNSRVILRNKHCLFCFIQFFFSFLKLCVFSFFSTLLSLF